MAGGVEHEEMDEVTGQMVTVQSPARDNYEMYTQNRTLRDELEKVKLQLLQVCTLRSAFHSIHESLNA